MNLNKLLAMLKPKPKPRPIYVGDQIVGWDDGLPNSVIIDRVKLVEGILGRSVDHCYNWWLAGLGRIRPSVSSDFEIAKIYADIALYARYTACTGVSTGGWYLHVRNQQDPFLYPSPVNSSYWVELAQAQATADHRLWKTVAGTPTILGTEAVDLAAESEQDICLGASGTTLKSARAPTDNWNINPDAPIPSGDVKITVTDTSISEGSCGLAVIAKRYTPSSYWGAISYWPNAWIPLSHMLGHIRPPFSSPPEPIAYFEVPIVGSGKLPTTPDGYPKPVTIWDEEDVKAQVDPFRVELPQEIVEIEQPKPKILESKINILKAKGWKTEEIKAFMPEAFPVERINRLAVTWSALIPTDSKGKPTSNTALVRVFHSSPEYVHPIEKRIQAIKEMRGVRQLSREEAISLALKMDDKLHIHDLVPCMKHEFGGKCFKEYRDWRIHTVGDKPEFADTDIRKRYVKEMKGW
jgi:hypothetical protein